MREACEGFLFMPNLKVSKYADQAGIPEIVQPVGRAIIVGCIAHFQGPVVKVLSLSLSYILLHDCK